MLCERAGYLGRSIGTLGAAMQLVATIRHPTGLTLSFLDPAPGCKNCDLSFWTLESAQLHF